MAWSVNRLPECGQTCISSLGSISASAGLDRGVGQQWSVQWSVINVLVAGPEETIILNQLSASGSSYNR